MACRELAARKKARVPSGSARISRLAPSSLRHKASAPAKSRAPCNPPGSADSLQIPSSLARAKSRVLCQRTRCMPRVESTRPRRASQRQLHHFASLISHFMKKQLTNSAPGGRNGDGQLQPVATAPGNLQTGNRKAETGKVPRLLRGNDAEVAGELGNSLRPIMRVFKQHRPATFQIFWGALLDANPRIRKIRQRGKIVTTRSEFKRMMSEAFSAGASK